MYQYKRPEKELDEAKKPGQVINKPPESAYYRRTTNGGPKYLKDVIERIQHNEPAPYVLIAYGSLDGNWVRVEDYGLRPDKERFTLKFYSQNNP
jgi:hypothetical protein